MAREAIMIFSQRLKTSCQASEVDLATVRDLKAQTMETDANRAFER